jgi:hypothetical protein
MMPISTTKMARITTSPPKVNRSNIPPHSFIIKPLSNQPVLPSYILFYKKAIVMVVVSDFQTSLYHLML